MTSLFMGGLGPKHPEMCAAGIFFTDIRGKNLRCRNQMGLGGGIPLSSQLGDLAEHLEQGAKIEVSIEGASSRCRNCREGRDLLVGGLGPMPSEMCAVGIFCRGEGQKSRHCRRGMLVG